MRLKDLVGRRKLSGFDREIITRYVYGNAEGSETVYIVLDGKTWELWENPEDGYRSTHKGPIRTTRPVQNVFAPVEVSITHRAIGGYNNYDDVLEFRHATSGALILEIGTADVAGYYLSWECNWSAEALSSDVAADVDKEANSDD